jgi:hypothetical protein
VISSRWPRPRWGLGPQIIVAVLIASAPVAAGELRETTIDGLYVTAGPLAAGTRIGGEWTSGVGLELSIVGVREHALPAAWGVCGGWHSYTERAGGRIWLEAEVAVKRPLPFAVGLGIGPALEVDRIRPARPGAQATLWIFAGIVPYVRVGALRESGGFVELGVMAKLPFPRIAAW